MRNIIRLYYRYLLSKEVVIILLAILAIFTGGVLYSSGLFEGIQIMTLYLTSNQIFFLQDYLIITKLISLVLSVLLVIVLYTETSQNLRMFVIDSISNKYMFYLLKSMFSIIVTILTTLVMVSILVLIYNIFTPYYIESSIFINIFTYLIVQNLFYVFLTHLLITILPNIIIGFLPIVLFWYMEINFLTLLDSGSTLSKIITTIIPSISLNLGEIKLYSNIIIHLIFIVIFKLLYLTINLKKDIN